MRIDKKLLELVNTGVWLYINRLDARPYMKVLFVACHLDPFDHNAGSGKDYDLYQALQRNGAQLRVAGPFALTYTLPERIYRKFHSILMERRPAKYSHSYLSKAARQVRLAIDEFQPDVIFSKYAAILCRLKTELPIVTLADTTLYGSHREWPIFTDLAFIRQSRWEQKTYDRSQSIITQSHWSADILVDHYRQPVAKIQILAAPASIPESVVPKKISIKTLTPLKLLLVGREPQRKGIDIAIEVTQKLILASIPTHLRIVGIEGENTGQVEFRGLYNKSIPEQLEAYVENYRWANFLIHPARFEAAGIAPAEAAAFGVPTITNNVGGLGTTVADGVSGIVLPKHSPAEAYVETIKRYLDNQQAYASLCASTRLRYDAELNWEVAGKRLYQFIEKCCQIEVPEIV